MATAFAADSLEVMILVENWVDMLLADSHEHDDHCVTRHGLIEHFDPNRLPPQAENGISFLVRARRGRDMLTVLFDVGLTGSVLLHNMDVFGISPAEIDHVVISHGHPDHYGGITRLLGSREQVVPIVTHPQAFLPRYAVMPDGRTSGFYNSRFNESQIERDGGRTVKTRTAVELGWGVVTTGEISRDCPFEGPRRGEPRAPGLYQVADDGTFGLDEVWDEQGLVIDVKGEGLVVLTGCAHAGVINTLHAARALSPDRPLRAVMGGFHLGFPTTPAENVDRTIEELRELDVRLVVPMHCSGLRAHVAMSGSLPGRYVQPAVGTTFRFGKP